MEEQNVFTAYKEAEPCRCLRPELPLEVIKLFMACTTTRGHVDVCDPCFHWVSRLYW